MGYYIWDQVWLCIDFYSEVKFSVEGLACIARSVHSPLKTSPRATKSVSQLTSIRTPILQDREEAQTQTALYTLAVRWAIKEPSTSYRADDTAGKNI